VAIEKNRELGLPPRKPPQIIAGVDFLPEFLADANLFVDELGDRLGIVVKYGVAIKVLFCPRAPTVPPCFGKFFGQLDNEGSVGARAGV
jgi:hypothetical protein